MNEETTQPKPRKALKIVGWSVLLLAAVIPMLLFAVSTIALISTQLGEENEYQDSVYITTISILAYVFYLNILTIIMYISFRFRDTTEVSLPFWKKCFQLCALLNALAVGSHLIATTSVDPLCKNEQEFLLTLSDGTKLPVDISPRRLDGQSVFIYPGIPEIPLYFGDDGWKYDPARKLYVDRNGRTATLNIHESSRTSQGYMSSSKVVGVLCSMDSDSRTPFGFLYMFGLPLTITVLLGIGVKRQQRRAERPSV